MRFFSYTASTHVACSFSFQFCFFGTSILTCIVFTSLLLLLLLLLIFFSKFRNVSGYYTAIEHYRKLYEKKYDGVKLNEVQFRNLVKSVGIARQTLMTNLLMKETFVTVQRYESEKVGESGESGEGGKSRKIVVEFQEVMSRQMFEKFHEVK